MKMMLLIESWKSLLSNADNCQEINEYIFRKMKKKWCIKSVMV